MPTTRANRRTVRRSGGKFVFQGSYGCTYQPAIKCIGENARSEGTISKIMDSYEATKEFHVRGLFEPIDAEQKYFLYPIRMCNPDVTQNPENNYKSCTSVPVNVRGKGHGLKSMLYKDGGDNLGSNQLDNEDYVPFFESLANLFEGLVLLKQAKVIHADIKPPNIVSKKLEDGSFQTCFIDFGLSKPFNYFANGARAPYDADYRYWPVDLKVFHREYLTQYDDITTSVVYNHIRTALTPNYPLSYIGTTDGHRAITPHFSAAQYRELDQMLATGLIEPDVLLEKIDIFGLGRSLYEIYFRLTGHTLDDDDKVKVFRTVNIGNVNEINRYHDKLKTTVSKPLLELIRQMVHPNPSVRIDVEDALATYNSLLPAMREVFADFPRVRRLDAMKIPPTPEASASAATQSEPSKRTTYKKGLATKASSAPNKRRHSRVANFLPVISENANNGGESNNSFNILTPTPEREARAAADKARRSKTNAAAAAASIFSPKPVGNLKTINLFEPAPAKKTLKRATGYRNLV